MKKIVEFFDKLEEKLENIWENKNRMKKGMSVFTGRKIAGAFALVGLDLLFIINWITGFDYMYDYFYFIIFLIIGIIACEICTHFLNKRIKAQETEELAEDLEDDIARIAVIVVIIAFIALFILGWIRSLNQD